MGIGGVSSTFYSSPTPDPSVDDSDGVATSGDADEPAAPSMEGDTPPESSVGRASGLSLNDSQSDPQGTFGRDDQAASPEPAASPTSPSDTYASDTARQARQVLKGGEMTGHTALRAAGLVGEATLTEAALTKAGGALSKLSPLASAAVIADAGPRAVDAWNRGDYWDTMAHGLQATGAGLNLAGGAMAATGVGAGAGALTAGVGTGAMWLGAGMEYGRMAYNWISDKTANAGPLSPEDAARIVSPWGLPM